jgi:hypothetical protein
MYRREGKKTMMMTKIEDEEDEEEGPAARSLRNFAASSWKIVSTRTVRHALHGESVRVFALLLGSAGVKQRSSARTSS